MCLVCSINRYFKYIIFILHKILRTAANSNLNFFALLKEANDFVHIKSKAFNVSTQESKLDIGLLIQKSQNHFYFIHLNFQDLKKIHML